MRERRLHSQQSFIGDGSDDRIVPSTAVEPRSRLAEPDAICTLSRDSPVMRISAAIAGSRQFVEQRLCLFQIGGVEALGEPAVNRREQIARFGPPALFAP